MKDFLTGLLIYASFALTGIACAAHVLEQHSYARWAWATIFTILGTVTPIAVAWPRRAGTAKAQPAQNGPDLPTTEEWMRANRSGTSPVQTNDSTAR